MNVLQEVMVNCPYCGEVITLLADVSEGAQEYFEDCEVCCRPMAVFITVAADDSCRVDVRSESDCN